MHSGDQHNEFRNEVYMTYTEYEEPTIWERCCQCSFWVKYSLFGINFLVWIGSLCLIGIGIWARLEKQQLGAFDNISTDPAIFLIAVGCLMFFISISGCVGALRENISLLKVFCIMIAFIFLVEVVSGILAFVFMDTVKDNLITYMKQAVVTYQDDQDLQDAVDYVQRRFRCCGAATYNDWEANIYFNCSSPARSHCGVPMSCCRERTNVQCGFQMRSYGEGYASHSIYTKGCITSLMVIFKDNLIIIGLIAFALGFIELFSIVLAHVLIKNILLARKDFRESIQMQLANSPQSYDSSST